MVYTVTLNPALDYVMRCDYVGSEDINRAKTAEILLGGKGINVSVVLSRLGIPTKAIALAAGFTGHELERLVQAEGIETEFVYLEHGTTRINVKLFAQEQFDVNAPGPEVTDKDIEALFAVLDKLEEGDVLVLAGAVPGSCPEDIYERILKRLDGRGIKFVVDTTGEGLMKVLPYKPFLIKPNHHEISELFHDDVKKTDVDLIVKYAKKLQEMGAVNVLVSSGGAGATLVDETGAVNSEGIAPGECINNVGCGDSMVAGFVAGYETKQDYAYALKLGSAAGSASAFNDGLAPGEQIWEVYHNCFED
ncbi:MAG: 1-phosphofructokinase [Clostridia bacterium]|nr:1-phosphofructokinase [Clostridia bacterium]